MTEENSPEIWDAIWTSVSKKEEDYKIKAEENSIQWQRIEKIILNQFGSFKGLKTIEIGAGSGTNSLLFAMRGADVTVLDFSKKALERSKTFFGRRGIKVNTILCDALNLDKNLFKKYDVSMSFGVVEHFEGENRTKVNLAHFKVLKKNGLALICLPNSANLPYMIWKFLSQATGKWKWGTEIPFSRKELREFIKPLNKKYFFIGDWIFASITLINPFRLVKRWLGMKRNLDTSKIKRQKGTFLDEYFSPYITLVGIN
jgi:2-polyprenyl-3-methyl-5-hydroxy-6-metoxy-1,4-benzoquinol methylase